MSTIVEFTIATEEFSLGSAFQGGAFDRVELDRAVPITDTIVPFIWVYGSDPAALREHLSADEHVGDVQILDQLNGATLVRVEWHSELNGFLENVRTQDGRVLTASGTPDRWEFQLRFHTSEDITTFQQACREEGISLEITSVHELRQSEAGAASGSTAELTAAQREVLVAALEGGYFSIPRKTTLVDLAKEMDISDQAVSERLRRALVKLSTAAVVTDLDD